MMVIHQEKFLFASSVGFTTSGNIVEPYSSKNHFKKVQIPKISPGDKEGCILTVWSLYMLVKKLNFFKTIGDIKKPPPEVLNNSLVKVTFLPWKISTFQAKNSMWKQKSAFQGGFQKWLESHLESQITCSETP